MPTTSRTGTPVRSTITKAKTAGGVDANAGKQHLMELAKKLDIGGRSRMTQSELVDAIQQADARSTRKARGR